MAALVTCILLRQNTVSIIALTIDFIFSAHEKTYNLPCQINIACALSPKQDSIMYRIAIFIQHTFASELSRAIRIVSSDRLTAHTTLHVLPFKGRGIYLVEIIAAKPATGPLCQCAWTDARLTYFLM